MSGIDPAALDRHITGNYGEDQFRDEVVPDPREAAQDREATLWEVERDLRERLDAVEPRSDEYYSLRVQLRSVVRRARGMGPV